MLRYFTTIVLYWNPPPPFQSQVDGLSHSQPPRIRNNPIDTRKIIPTITTTITITTTTTTITTATTTATTATTMSQQQSETVRSLRRRLWKALQEENIESALRAYTATQQDLDDWQEEERCNDERKQQQDKEARLETKQVRP